MGAQTLWLSTDCFACRTQGYWIILSIDQDRYFGIPEDELAAAGKRLPGQSRHPASGSAGNLAGDSGALIDSMRLAGIITEQEGDGKPFTESTRFTADSSIDERGHFGPARLSLALILRFVIASARVDYMLRNSRMSRILRRVIRINGRLKRNAQGRGETSFDIERASTLIAAFMRLRPFYPRRYLCLYDSLALLEFLTSYGLAARLVFGVIAEPFEAHCWLQQGTTVLNDELERVARYTAILTT